MPLSNHRCGVQYSDITDIPFQLPASSAWLQSMCQRLGGLFQIVYIGPHTPNAAEQMEFESRTSKLEPPQGFPWEKCYYIKLENLRCEKNTHWNEVEGLAETPDRALSNIMKSIQKSCVTGTRDLVVYPDKNGQGRRYAVEGSAWRGFTFRRSYEETPADTLFKNCASGRDQLVC